MRRGGRRPAGYQTAPDAKTFAGRARAPFPMLRRMRRSARISRSGSTRSLPQQSRSTRTTRSCMRSRGQRHKTANTRDNPHSPFFSTHRAREKSTTIHPTALRQAKQTSWQPRPQPSKPRPPHPGPLKRIILIVLHRDHRRGRSRRGRLVLHVEARTRRRIGETAARRRRSPRRCSSRSNR